MNNIHMILVTLALLLCAAPAQAEPLRTTPRGVQYKDLQTGAGEVVEVGDVVTVHFKNWLDSNGAKGREIYDTRKQNQKVSFVVGTERVMPGWNEGVIGMREGGKRMLKLPSSLAYGSKGVKGTVPPGAKLIFVFDLVLLEKR